MEKRQAEHPHHRRSGDACRCIRRSSTLEIRFSFLALALSCALYGFWPNLVFAFVVDLLGWVVHPSGAYVPLFALVLMVKAFIYAMSFYGKDKISIPRVVVTQFLVCLICNVLLNPLLLTMMYNMPYWALVASRIVKNLCMFPIECVVLYLAFRLLPAARTRMAKN